MIKKTLLITIALFLLVMPFASAGSFIVHNTTNEAQTFLMVNGTTGYVSMASNLFQAESRWKK